MPHPYKVKSPKTVEGIKADADELRKGASVDPENAQRLATEYESNYLRRHIAQINKDYEAGRIKDNFGAELIRRVENGYEPPDYPPREDRDQPY